MTESIDRSADILTAIEKQGSAASQASRDQLDAIHGLAGEIRDLCLGVTKVMHRPAVANGRNGNWVIISVIGSMVAALMLPMYIMVQGLEVNIAEHKTLAGHPEAANRLAALTVNLQEIETQFKGVDAEIFNIVKSMDFDNLREGRDIASDSAQWERIRFLERLILGEPLQKFSSNGNNK